MVVKASSRDYDEPTFSFSVIQIKLIIDASLNIDVPEANGREYLVVYVNVRLSLCPYE